MGWLVKIIVEFDDPDIFSVNESVKPYDMDFYDLFEDALSIGFCVLGLDDVHQFLVYGLRDRDLAAYRAFSENYEKWLNDRLFLQAGTNGRVPS
jgi:hypothetical protein